MNLFPPNLCQTCGDGFVPRAIRVHDGGAELIMSCLDRHPGPTVFIPAGSTYEFVRVGRRIDAFNEIAAVETIPLTVPPEAPA